MGAATVSATTRAFAPGYTVVTCTVGGVILGYCSIGRLYIATTPRITVMIAMTLAKTGRSMKNLDNIGLP